MRYPIDVVYLDGAGLVVALEPALAPWSLGALHRGARATLELPAGTIAVTATEAGDVVDFEPAAPRANSGPRVEDTAAGRPN
jgi:uncharacterized membrane protein (UPF0127 family)